jgi:hypothetical protein
VDESLCLPRRQAHRRDNGAVNCVYDIFAATEDEFSLVFPPGTDVAFIDEVYDRGDPAALDAAFDRIWARRQAHPL